MTTTPWRRLIAALATATILPFALSACGDDSSDKDASSSSDDNKDNTKDDESSDEDEDAAEDAAEQAAEDALEGMEESGDIDVETGDLPDGFPEEVALVGDVQSGVAVDLPNGRGWSASTSYDGSVAEAVAEASAALTGAGFEDQSGGTVAGGGLFTNGQYSVTVAAVDAEEAGVLLSYIVAPEVG